jgi:hypothetical protein
MSRLGWTYPFREMESTDFTAVVQMLADGFAAIPHQPLDVLAQQIVAEVAAQDWPEAALYQRYRRALEGPHALPSTLVLLEGFEAPAASWETEILPARSTPIALLDRRRLILWLSLSPQISASLPSPRAQLLVDCLRTNGAMFFDELAEVSHLLRPQVEDALGELVALGSVTSDSFAGLRALLVPSSRRKPIAGVKRRGLRHRTRRPLGAAPARATVWRHG